MRHALGIDNGFTGALVLVDENFRIVKWADTPTVLLTKKGRTGKTKNAHEFAPSAMRESLLNVISDIDLISLKIWLEVAQSMPGQGVASTFKIGRGFGLWEGIVAGMDFQYDIVHPRTWTKVMLADIPAGDPKQRTLIKAQRLFGSQLPLTKPKGSVLSMDGRADAALIAYYGMCQMLGTKPTVITKKPVPKRRF